MITYTYWIIAIILVAGTFVLLNRTTTVKTGMIGASAVLFIAWAAYFFHFQQVFVKHYGGIMSVSVPKGQMHIAATWKDDNLWVENYDPGTNTCHFNEYSKGNLLQGKVLIKNCSPLLPPTMNSEVVTP
jgi:hypothetical protein